MRNTIIFILTWGTVLSFMFNKNMDNLNLISQIIFTISFFGIPIFYAILQVKKFDIAQSYKKLKLINFIKSELIGLILLSISYYIFSLLTNETEGYLPIIELSFFIVIPYFAYAIYTLLDDSMCLDD